MEIAQSASINEKSVEKVAKENEERKKERNREYQRAFRQRNKQKQEKHKYSKEEKEARKRKRHRENQRAYYQRAKGLKKNDKNIEGLFQKKLDDLQIAMAASKKWRETETVKFVRLYEEAECLWNYRHPAYKNRSAREKACQTIIESMNMPEFGVNELKNKIKNIRSTYAQELNKIKRSRADLSGAGSDQEEYKTNLAWFAIANRFLGTVITTPSNSNKMPKNEDSSAADFSSSDFQLTTLVKTDIDENPEYADESRELYYPPISIDHTQIKAELSSDDYTVPCKRRRLLHDGEINDEKESDPEPCDVRDEFFYFGKNVACQLRQLPLDKALLCQSKILGLLMTHRVESLHSV